MTGRRDSNESERAEAKNQANSGSKNTVAQAEESVRQAVATYGKRHPAVADALDHYADVLLDLDLSEHALKFRKIAVEIRNEKTGGPGKPSKKLSSAIQKILDQFDGNEPTPQSIRTQVETAFSLSTAAAPDKKGTAKKQMFPPPKKKSKAKIRGRQQKSLSEIPLLEPPPVEAPAVETAEPEEVALAEAPEVEPPLVETAHPAKEEEEEAADALPVVEVPVEKAALVSESTPRLAANGQVLPRQKTEKELNQTRIWNMTFLLIFAVLIMVLGCALLQSSILVRLFS